MNATLSTSGWVLHDLGLATSVGGAIFGKTGLHPAVRKISSKEERGLVTNEAWRDFSPINLFSHVAVVLTWLTGRAGLSGRSIDRGTRRLVYVKDALVGTYLASGLTSTAAGYALSRASQGAPPQIESGSEPSSEAPERARVLQRTSDIAGFVNLAAGAAIIGVTAVLATKSGRSFKWSFVSRFLP
jgi:hypothetical protein